MKGLTYIETFAGCGGLSLGLHQAGWKGLFAIERDPMAFETLRRNLVEEGAPYRHFKNWPEWLPRGPLSLEELLGDKRYRHELEQLRECVTMVAGGPPCQGFSVGGARNGSDQRNSLVFRHLEFVALVQPEVVLVENVEGMARRFDSRPGDLRGSPAFAVMSALHELGYIMTSLTVTASDYGVPQNRRRLILFGMKSHLARGLRSSSLFEDDISEAVAIEFAKAAREQRSAMGLPLDRPVTVFEAIHDLASPQRIPSPDSRGYQTAPYLPAKSRYSKIMRNGIPDSETPDSHRFSHHGPKVQALYEKAHATQPRGRLSRQFLLRNDTKTQKKVLLDPEGVSTTLTTHPDESIHYAFPRNISLREMARFQSFPDDFRFYGRYTLNGPRRRFDVPRCAQIGNAVPPLLGRGLGVAIARLYKQALQSKKKAA